MTWNTVWTGKSIATEVDVQASDFDAEQLLQALIDHGVIDEGLAAALLAKSRRPRFEQTGPDHLTIARNAMVAGNTTAATRALEDFLGADFHGRITVKGR